MDKYFMWIHNHNKEKHNKTVCIFLGIYCMNVCPAARGDNGDWWYIGRVLDVQISVVQYQSICVGSEIVSGYQIWAGLLDKMDYIPSVKKIN